ncbi:LysE family translocator [Rhodoferax sp. GW822-FHT02A01]|uniref:LysE family translocator n=1 Tax=Rhodoferax sp. GW822-FHT02A01 TaxID=3141537 RepID=UPI00315C5D00
MNYELLVAASLFAVVSLITPGPNNTMVLTSGVNFGLQRTLPHLLGICIGFGLMQVLVGLGLHTLLGQYPSVLEILRYVGGAYMLWLAWKLATSRSAPGVVAASTRPLGFWGAAAFQWVNPKAWVMCMTAMTAYLPTQASTTQVLMLGSMFTVLGIPCVGTWAAFGSSMRRFLQDPLKLRIFNNAMALALVASLYPMLMN